MAAQDFGITNASDASFAPQFNSYLSNFLGQIPGVSDSHISSGLEAARAGWGGAFGSGSNPFTAAYQAAINIGNSAGFDFTSAVPYDQSFADQMQQAAVDRSPEGQARANDSGFSWNDIRDPIEALGAVAGNYFLPGSGLVTSRLVSEGAQKDLSSDAGRLAMIGSGVGGALTDQAANYGKLYDAATGATPAVSSNPADYFGEAQGAPGTLPYTGAGAGISGNPADYFGEAQGAPGTEPYTGAGVPVGDPGGDSFGPGAGDPSALQYLRSLQGASTGAPVTELGRNFTGFNAGNGAGSDASAILRSIVGGGSASGGGVLGSGGIGSIPMWLSAGSGIYGLLQARKLRQLAAAGAPPGVVTPGVAAAVTKANTGVDKAVSQAAPFDTTQVPLNGGGTSTGRDIAVKQLGDLLQNPGSITSRPGYQAGIEAVQRGMAAQGYTNSGNELAALQKYGGDFYNNAIAQLSSLAGANQSPATGASVGISGANTNLAGGQLDLSSILGTGGQNIDISKLNLTGNIAANDLVSKSLASIGYGAGGGGAGLSPQLIQALQLLARNGSIQ